MGLKLSARLPILHILAISPSCLWSLKIFPSLPGSRLQIHGKFSPLTPRQPMVKCYLLFELSRFPPKQNKSPVESRTHESEQSYTARLTDTSPKVLHFFPSFFFFNLTYNRWTSSLPSCLWSLRIFPSLPGSRLTMFYRDASSALLQLVNQWLNFTYSRPHAFCYERKNTNPTLVRIELTTSALAGVQVTY